MPSPLSTLVVAGLAAFAMPAGAEPTAARFPRAQAVADRIVAGHPGLIDAIIHVSPRPEAPNVVIGAHLRKAVGEASGADDVGVASTGAPLVEVQKDGVRLGVLVQMRDVRHRPIGALGLMYAYKPGDDVEARVRASFAIRDAVAAGIASREALVRG